MALHSTRLGPAFGGCRMYPYADPAQALTDALRLPRGMTYKAAICELPYGGGKSVVLADPRRDKTPELLRAMGRVIEGLGGRYITADDVGTTLADLAVMREVTRHTAGATAAAQEPLAVTAYGVLMAIEAAVRHYYQRADFEGLRFAVQGLGNVGYPCASICGRVGASLMVSDVDPARTAKAASELQAEVVGPEAIYEQTVDVFAPCALGAVLNDRTVPNLRVRLVCGGANNQLAEAAPRRDARRARHRLRAGLSRQCRRRDRLPPGGDRRQPGGGAAPRSSASGTSPAIGAGARRRHVAKPRCRSPTGSCATASAPQPRGSDMATCGEVLVQMLEAYGVDTVFGIPGVHTVELYRGLPATRIRHVTPRHEQGAGFMADGYARVSGKPGRLLHHHRPGHDQHPDRDGPGLRRFGPDAGDLERQPHRAARRWARAGCTSCARSRRWWRASPPSATPSCTRASCPRCWPGPSRCSPARRPRPVHIEIPIDVITAPGDGLHAGATAPARAAGAGHPMLIARGRQLLAGADDGR